MTTGEMAGFIGGSLLLLALGAWWLLRPIDDSRGWLWRRPRRAILGMNAPAHQGPGGFFSISGPVLYGTLLAAALGAFGWLMVDTRLDDNRVLVGSVFLAEAVVSVVLVLVHAIRPVGHRRR